MLVFVLSVLVFNLIFFLLLLLIRHTIPITTRVLLMTAPAAFLCTVSLPYLAAVLDYTQLAVAFTGMILLFALLLTMADNRYPAPFGRTAGAGNQPDVKGEQNCANQLAAEKPSLVEATPPAALRQVEQTPDMLISEETVPALAADTPPVEAEPMNTAEILQEQIEPVSAMTKMVSTEPVTEKTTTPVPVVAQAPPEQDETIPAPGEQLQAGQIELPPESEPANLEPAKPLPDLPNEHPEQIEPAAAQKPEPLTDGADSREHELKRLITRGFAFKRSGHYQEAAQIFYKALEAQPESKLTVLLVLEISDIYREIGQTWQAAEILKILLKNKPAALDARLFKRLELKFIELQKMLNQKGVQA